jgi:uncharacterized protein YbgA (DUF1722 family)/uncharacterized protein YbbK (DUF523 family)
MSKFSKPTIVLSACIEHKKLRYDGSVISSDFVKRLIPFVHFKLVCPETEIGLPSPREALRLVRKEHDGEVQLLSSIHGVDHTQDMVDFTNRYIHDLKDEAIDGFLLKAKSPTCGFNGVKVYRDVGKANVYSQKQSGFFGGALVEAYPTHPLQTERHISNFVLRDHFYTSIFTLARFRTLKEDHKMKELVAFHSEFKYLFMTFSQSILNELGQIVANHEKRPSKMVYDFYEEKLRILLKEEPSKKKRINVYTHMYGYFKDRINKEEKDFFFETLNNYQNEKVPYTNVLTILISHAIRFNEKYLRQQMIFTPYPKELLLVNDSGKQL